MIGPKPIVTPRSTRVPAALDVVLVGFDAPLVLEPDARVVVFMLVLVDAGELEPVAGMLPFTPTVDSAA